MIDFLIFFQKIAESLNKKECFYFKTMKNIYKKT